MRSWGQNLPPRVDQAVFDRAIDIWRFEVYRTRNLPPVQPAMCAKPRQTDVDELLRAIAERLRPFQILPRYLCLDVDQFADAVATGHYSELAGDFMIVVPRWVPVLMARVLRRYLFNGVPIDAAFAKVVSFFAGNSIGLRDAASQIVAMLAVQPSQSEMPEFIRRQEVICFPREFAHYIRWALSRYASSSLTLAEAIGIDLGRKRGGPKYSSFSERVIAAEVLFYIIKKHRDGDQVKGYLLEEDFENIRSNGEIGLLKDTLIHGWDDGQPIPSITGVELLACLIHRGG